MPCVAVNDRRAAAVVMVFGGGDLTELIRHNIRRFSGVFVSEIAGLVGGTLLGPLEPLRYAKEISPMLSL